MLFLACQKAEMDRNRFLQLLGDVYSTTLSPEKWTEVLDSVSQAVSGSCATITRFDFSKRDGSIVASSGMTRECARRYRERFSMRDVHMLRCEHVAQEGKAILGSQLCTEEELVASDYYNQFMAPNDWFHWISVCLRQENAGLLALTNYRPQQAGDFGRADEEVLELLAPHCKRATVLSAKFTEAAELQSSMQNALDLACNGVIITDENAQPKFMNQAARHLLDRADGIECNGSGIKVSDRDLQTELLQAIRRTASATHLRPPSSIFVRRYSRKSDFVVLVARCKRVGMGAGHVMLIIVDRESNPPSRTGIASQVFNLSFAETRLLNGIASGYSIEELSTEFRLSQNTLRSQLKAIFHKTGTNRQSELVRLITAFPSFETEDLLTRTEAA